MKFGYCINTTTQNLTKKEFNYWIGISLGNKYFNKENIQKYIEWALDNTKDSVLIVIADWIYSINIQVFDERNQQSAVRKALRIGDKKLLEINEILNKLPPQQLRKIHIIRWNDIEKNHIHQNRVKILFEEFNKKGNFYNHIIDIIKDNFKFRIEKLKQIDLEKLSEYVLHEIPLFLDGIDAFNTNYNAILYPKIGLIDTLEKDLQDGTSFPDLTKQLAIQKPAAIIEAHVD